MPRPLALVAALLALAPLGSPAAAQPFPVVPDPADCRVAPRPTEELLAFWFPAGGTLPAATPAAAATEVTVPIGPSADAETVAGVTAAVREFYACLAAGDLKRLAGLLTDDLARRELGPPPGTTEAEARAFLEAPPVPVAEGRRIRIAAIADVMALTDGRAGVFVVEEFLGEQNASFAVLARRGDRWLAAETVEFARVGEG